MSLLDRISDSFKNNPAARATMLAGGAVGAYTLGLATPEVASMTFDAFNIVLGYTPQLDLIAQSNTFMNSAMEYVATVGTGLADWAEAGGIEIAKGIRDSVTEMQAFLGNNLEGARDIFHGTISSSVEFLDKAKEFASENAPKNVFDAGKMIVGGLAAASGAWEGMKLVRAGFRKVFGTTPDPEATETQNIQINIAVNGGLVSEEMADQVSDAISESAPEMSEAAMASTREAIRSAAQRNVEESAPLGADANSGIFQNNMRRPAANDDQWSAEFDPAFAGRVTTLPYYERQGALLEEMKSYLRNRSEGPIHPRDLGGISRDLKWLVEHELGPKNDPENPRASLPQIDGGIILHVIPRDGGEISRVLRPAANDSQDDYSGPSC